MKEAFLHYVWKTQSFTTSKFTTHKGDSLKVISPGEHNHNAGPDFHNAKLKIGDTVWVGDVEIHIRSSDWTRHNHHLDESYETCILHVVYTLDIPVRRMDGTEIPHLQISPHINPKVVEVYEKLMGKQNDIPCEGLADANTWYSEGIEQLLLERSEQKSWEIPLRLKQLNHDWVAVLYEWIATSLGAKVNNNAFKVLATRAPYLVLRKYHNSVEKIESILMGVAGFLEASETTRFLTYQTVKQAHKLSEMNRVHWKYSRLRPNAFPEKRIRYLALLVPVLPEIFELAEKNDVNGLKQLLQEHIPESLASSVLINGIYPVVYYRMRSEREIQVRSILESLPPEKNKIIHRFAPLGFPNNNAAESQAQVHLYQNYCLKKRCLECPFGERLLAKA